MSVGLGERPADRGPSNGGAPARRAVVRWAWRLFRREWRQQVLVLALLTVAVAGTVAGVALVTNVPSYQEGTFGTADRILTLPGSDPHLGADVAAARTWFGTIDVIAHQRIAVPGSVATVDLRAQDPHGPYGGPTVRLLSGRYPSGPDEVAVTNRVAAIFDLHVGATWHQDGEARRVVGLVENPGNLLDQFALVAPGQADPPTSVTILLDATESRLESFRLTGGLPTFLEGRSLADRRTAAIIVLVLATIGLLFVALLAVAGFAAMAQRRLRAMGMLGAIGATDRHVRLVMLTGGAVVGAVAAVAGAAVGLAGWLVFAPHLESIAEHRIDRFDVPWWAIGAAMVLAVVAAVTAAWWPARSAARIPVVAALSGRHPRPQPAHRFAALGGVLLVAGLGLLALARERRPVFIVTGIVATALGVLLLAPASIRGLAAAGRRSPIAVRLALRDLVRYQARAGAALGAVILAVAIAATIAVSAASAQAADAATGGNLPPNQLIVYVNLPDNGSPVPQLTASQLQALQGRVRSIATSVGATSVLTLEEAFDPASPSIPPGNRNGTGGKDPASLARVTTLGGRGIEVSFAARLYVATPALLARYGIALGQVAPDTDILSARTDLATLQVFAGPGPTLAHPKVETAHLPKYGSDPNTLITAHAIQTLGLQSAPVAWLVEAPRTLTAAQMDAARKQAAGAGVSIETRNQQASLTQLRTDATVGGILVALGVLAMTIGLIRSESAGDLRTLTATGAGSAVRRTLTGATAGALGLLGALLGTGGAYLALLAWHRSDVHALSQVPVVNLVAIIAGLPLIAAAAGWLLAGREPPSIARQPLG